jgi:hypothetical protein
MTPPADVGRGADAKPHAPERDEAAHRAAVRGLHDQAARLGILDALDAEPALIFAPGDPR